MSLSLRGLATLAVRLLPASTAPQLVKLIRAFFFLPASRPGFLLPHQAPLQPTPTGSHCLLNTPPSDFLEGPLSGYRQMLSPRTEIEIARPTSKFGSSSSRVRCVRPNRLSMRSTMRSCSASGGKRKQMPFQILRWNPLLANRPGHNCLSPIAKRLLAHKSPQVARKNRAPTAKYVKLSRTEPDAVFQANGYRGLTVFH